ncbi:MFS glucose transporter, partial [Lachnellula occidentalis]
MALTSFNIAIVAFVALGSYTYAYAYAIFATTIGQAGFYTSFGLDPTSEYTASVIGAMSALFALGAGIGAILQGWTGDYLGRKKSFIMGLIVSLIGGALVAGSVNVPMFIVFRFVQGIGLGQCFAMSPLYISEVAPPRRRGLLTGLTASGLVSGYVTSAWVGYAAYFAKNVSVQWRLPLAISCLAPLVLLCGIYWMPESPRFLALVNRNEEAWAIIKKIHHDPTDVDDVAAHAEYTQICKQVELDKETEGGYIAMFSKPSWRKRSLLAVFIMFATQSTGCLGITTFQVIIYSSLGLKGPMPLLMYGVYVTVAAFFNFCGAASVDKIGRRRQLLIGYPLISVVLLINAILQKTYVGTTSTGGNAACVLFIFLFISVYSFFIDPPQFVFVSEIFPTNIRAKGIGLAFAAYFLGAITYTAPAAVAFKNIGWKMYMVWFAVSIVSSVLIYFFIPETKGLALEEIGELFGDKVVVHMTSDGRGIVEKGEGMIIDNEKEVSDNGLHVETSN